MHRGQDKVIARKTRPVALLRSRNKGAYMENLQPTAVNQHSMSEAGYGARHACGRRAGPIVHLPVPKINSPGVAGTASGEITVLC